MEGDINNMNTQAVYSFTVWRRERNHVVFVRFFECKGVYMGLTSASVQYKANWKYFSL